jgi:hypothetical protein
MRILVFATIIIFVILAGSTLLLLTRPSDYQAHFIAKTVPDVAYFSVLNWHSWNRNEMVPDVKILQKSPVSSLSVKISAHDSTFIFNWKFEKINDSTTLVRVNVSDPDRKVYNRLVGSFFNTRFKRDVRGNVLDIKDHLEYVSKSFRFRFTGFERFDSITCVAMRLKSTIRGKAMTMLANVTALNEFVHQNRLELNGPPFLVIYDWDESRDSITYDFCFPIRRQDAVPEDPKIKLQTVEGMDAVKTDFFGNYSLTDVTWHDLVNEARKMGYISNHKVIEVYYHDPHEGGDELEWKAGIYLGVQSAK